MPKWAKKRSDRGGHPNTRYTGAEGRRSKTQRDGHSSAHATAPEPLHHTHSTHKQRRTEDRGQRTEDRGQRTEDRGQRERKPLWTGHGQVVLSLLCLWPYGNSLIVSSHSEFYQCHTQNRSRYHPNTRAPAGLPMWGRSAGRSKTTQTTREGREARRREEVRRRRRRRRRRKRRRRYSARERVNTWCETVLQWRSSTAGGLHCSGLIHTLSNRSKASVS